VFDEKNSRIAKLPDVVGSSLTWEELTALVFQGAIFGKGREDGRWLLTYWDNQDACWCECVEETRVLQAQGVVRVTDPATAVASARACTGRYTAPEDRGAH
jgi:hypothetical protein